MFVRNKQHLVVDCYPPAKVRLLWLLIFALLAGLAWSIWAYAPAEVGRQLHTSSEQRLQLLQRLSEAEAARMRFKAEVERLQTMQEVDQQAYDLLQENFNTLQNENTEMSGQLAFYQAVVAPEKDNVGLKIQRFSVDAPVAGRHAYSLVLIQVQKTQTMVKGSLLLKVQGSLNGHKKTLSMRQVTRPAVDAVKLRFRYFQNIDGSLQFPAGFIPERVQLRLDVDYPHRDVKKSYSWSGLQARG